MTTSPVSVLAPWPLRGRSIQRIARQEIRDALLGWGVYLTAGAGLLLAVLLVYNSARFVAGSGLQILARPFLSPLVAASTLALLYVTVVATLAIARPREQGALQVLFFAPVDAIGLVGAYFVAGIVVYLLLVLLLVPLLVLLALLTNVFLPPALLWGLLPSVGVAGLAVAFGIFLSAVAGSSRSAVLLLVTVVILLFAIQGGYTALLNVPPTSRYYDALLFLRVFLRVLNDLLLWVSPIGMLGHCLDAALRNDLLLLLRDSVRAVAVSLVWLGLAVWAVRRRGVLP
ncbi:MAG: hypothetical protein M5U01_11760 [Ardenticatenaceae bacterium]|nr:hypothetical protein [Ardenticatenaceae bacterium]HBY97956.1 hypothetical protein [Chloroflexota bacterium]